MFEWQNTLLSSPVNTGVQRMVGEDAYVNQRFASVDKKLDMIDSKLDDLRKEIQVQRRECSSEADSILSHVNDVEHRHGSLLAQHTTELVVWRWRSEEHTS